MDFLESCLPEEIHGFGAARARAAVGDDLAAGVEFVHSFGQIAQGDQVAVDVADLVFVWLAHVEDEDIASRRRFNSST